MKGKIDGVEDWSYEDACYYLEEAGLKKEVASRQTYKCSAADAVEVVAVLEMCHDVEFSQTDYNRLARMMARGFIGRCSFLNWLIRCNTKPVRKTKTHAMPLFENGGAE